MQESFAMAPEAPVLPAALEAILRSPLLAQGNGFGLYQGLPDPYTFDALVSEAVEQYPSATSQQSWEPDVEELRGGKPRRSLLTSTAGPVQDAWYASDHLSRFVSSLFGLPVVPSGNRGSYSYYARKGDFLDIHRDINTCDVTVITGIYDNSAPADSGGALILYPGRTQDPLSAIRQRPQDGAYPIKLLPGQTIIFPGGVIPHYVSPVAEGQLRIISALCFRVLNGD
jgi:hypothetical protein